MVVEVMYWSLLFLAEVLSVITSSETCVYAPMNGTCSGQQLTCFDTCNGNPCEFFSCAQLKILLVQSWSAMEDYGKCFYNGRYDMITTCEEQGSVCDDDDMCLSVCSSSSGKCEGCFENPIDTSSMPTATCDQLAAIVVAQHYPQFTGYCECFTYEDEFVKYDAMLRCGTSTCETKPPTGMPTACAKYRNDEAALSFLGGGSSCRANIEESWTGGRTCDSPYIICLPQENTPSFSIKGNRYYDDTHRYTVNECKEECSNDQRCLGFEFVADPNSILGDCNLLDDVLVTIENQKDGFQYSGNELNLHYSQTGVEALCFIKAGNDYCNPYFEAEDLHDTMLNCYCPNNRKGLYTKRVQRTVAATRYCYNDPSVDERIKKAQANRMFHLCENWCLFETSNPEEESWFWDPWKQCYRETYPDTGYCDRVIKNPNTIEFKFVSLRTENFCDASE